MPLYFSICHILVATCQDVSSYRRETYCVCIVTYQLLLPKCVISSCCQDVSSFGGYLPRCFILLVGERTVSVLWRTSCCCPDVSSVLAAKMCHLLVATCQDVSSYGRETYCVCIVTYQLLLPRCVISSCCQDVSSFGGYLPRCFILLVGECTVFVLWRTSCCCPDVS